MDSVQSLKNELRMLRARNQCLCKRIFHQSEMLASKDQLLMVMTAEFNALEAKFREYKALIEQKRIAIKTARTSE